MRERGRVATGETTTEKENGTVVGDEGTEMKDAEEMTGDETTSERETRRKDDIGGERGTRIKREENGRAQNGRATEKMEDTGGERGETLMEGRGGTEMSLINGRIREKTAAAGGTRARWREMEESGNIREDLIKDQIQREKEDIGKEGNTLVDERTKGFTRIATEEEGEGFQRKGILGEDLNKARRRGAVRNL